MLRQRSLNGTWKLRTSDGERGRPEYAERDHTDPLRYINARVPGEVHLDAQRAGWIEEPGVGVNVLASRWIEENRWSYRREFVAPPEALRSRAWLVFDRLDLDARIVLNGIEVGRHANAFYPCRIEVTGHLRRRRNVLVVHVESGLYRVADKPIAGLARRDNMLLTKCVWLRKPQCQFAWDWSPRLINVGITGEARLEWTRDPVRADQFVPLVELSPDLKTGRVRGRWFIEAFGNVSAELTVEVAGQRATVPVTLAPGLSPVEASVEVANPKLWWPVGHGRQDRYAVRATLRVDGKIVAERSTKIGFRHVRVNQDPHPQQGRYFILEINGRKIFAKGGNFVPADLIFARCDRARYEELTDLALEANFNLLRVWGGGLYESDAFYECCDAKGILVWQEFAFACLKYPATDQEFYESVKAEAIHNIRRLASHPCLVVWCGNNEMELGAWEWGFDKGTVHPDYALFHFTLPRLLAQEDPTRYYQPSSPYSPDGLEPNRDDVGDQHPWQVGFHNLDFRDYRQMTCRFPNEGGFLGPTALPTMLACLPVGQQFVQSFAWQQHDNSVDSWAEPSPADEILQFWIGKDTRQLSIPEYVYWGGLIQGEALSEYVKNFRRRMFDSAAAVFWMFNDCWPATRSWTIVDSYRRRTPAFYPVRRAMAPVIVVVAEQDEEIVVFGVNDTRRPVAAELRFGIFNLAGGYPLDRRQPVVLAPNASTRLASFPRRDWKHPTASAAFAVLEHNRTIIARDRLILPLFKEMKWPRARIRVTLRGGRAFFHSRTFAWGVCLDLDGERALPDNFFDVFPGIPTILPWPRHLPRPRVLNFQAPVGD